MATPEWVSPPPRESGFPPVGVWATTRPSATPVRARPKALVCCRVAPITANATTKRTASAKRSGLTSEPAPRLIDRLVEHGSVRRLADSGSATVHEAAHRTLEAMADRSTAEALRGNQGARARPEGSH